MALPVSNTLTHVYYTYKVPSWNYFLSSSRLESCEARPRWRRQCDRMRCAVPHRHTLVVSRRKQIHVETALWWEVTAMHRPMYLLTPAGTPECCLHFILLKMLLNDGCYARTCDQVFVIFTVFNSLPLHCLVMIWFLVNLFLNCLKPNVWLTFVFRNYSSFCSQWNLLKSPRVSKSKSIEWSETDSIKWLSSVFIFMVQTDHAISNPRQWLPVVFERRKFSKNCNYRIHWFELHAAWIDFLQIWFSTRARYLKKIFLHIMHVASWNGNTVKSDLHRTASNVYQGCESVGPDSIPNVRSMGSIPINWAASHRRVTHNSHRHHLCSSISHLQDR